MSETGFDGSEPAASGYMPFAFGGIGIPHGAAFGAFLSRLEIEFSFNSIIMFELFLVLITAFVGYASYVALALFNLRGNYAKPLLGSFFLISGPYLMLGPNVADTYINKHLVFMDITLLFWAFFDRYGLASEG